MSRNALIIAIPELLDNLFGAAHRFLQVTILTLVESSELDTLVVEPLTHTALGVPYGQPPVFIHLDQPKGWQGEVKGFNGHTDGRRVVLVLRLQHFDHGGDLIVVPVEGVDVCRPAVNRTVRIGTRVGNHRTLVVVVHIGTQVERSNLTIRLRHGGIPQGLP